MVHCLRHVLGQMACPFFHSLTGERTPDLPRARGSLVGISSNNFTNENLIRAAVEGVSYRHFKWTRPHTGWKKTRRDLRDRRWFALEGVAPASRRCYGATIQVPAEEEAGSLGAAMQAMYAFHHAKSAPLTLA